MNFKIIVNPFRVLNDKKQTIIAISSLILGIILSYLLQVNIQVLRINPLSELNFFEVVLDQVILISITSLSFFGIGKIINKKTRFIDIFNTINIALIPIYLSLFQNINNFLTNETNKLVEEMQNGNILNLTPPYLFIIVGLFGFVLFIYYIYLFFVGFKTATNAKKTWHYVLFFATLISVDIITSILINLI